MKPRQRCADNLSSKLRVTRQRVDSPALSESRAANEGGFSEIGGVPALSSKEAVELFVWRVMDDVEVGGER